MIHYKIILPYLCLLAGMAVVGSYVALSKPLVAVMPVFILAFLRFSVAGVVMLPWLPRENGVPKLDAYAKRWLFLQSLLGNFLFSACMLYGVMYSNALTAGIVMAGIPAAVAMLSWVALKERISLRMGVAIALSCASVLMLQLAKNAAPVGAFYALGVVLLIAAVICEASYVVLAKKLSAYLSPKRGSALLNAWGWALTLPFAAWQFWDTGFELSGISAGQWALLGYYAVAASVLSTWLWFTGLRHVPANQAGVYTVALPITAAILGVVVFGEVFSVWHAAALGLAVASVVCASWPAKRVVSIHSQHG
jgi:drug/metabolite transporter (DMT)-like permease